MTEEHSPEYLETIVNQAGIRAVRGGQMCGAEKLIETAERVMVGNVNTLATHERERDRHVIVVRELGHFLIVLDLDLERKLAHNNWDPVLADMKTMKISLKGNPRTSAFEFVFQKQGATLLKTKGDIEHEVRVVPGGMADE